MFIIGLMHCIHNIVVIICTMFMDCVFFVKVLYKEPYYTATITTVLLGLLLYLRDEITGEQRL